MPQETIDAFKKYMVGMKGPLQAPKVSHMAMVVIRVATCYKFARWRVGGEHWGAGGRFTFRLVPQSRKRQRHSFTWHNSGRSFLRAAPLLFFFSGLLVP